jgi:hypothetical protein
MHQTPFEKELKTGLYALGFTWSPVEHALDIATGHEIEKIINPLLQSKEVGAQLKTHFGIPTSDTDIEDYFPVRRRIASSGPISAQYELCVETTQNKIAKASPEQLEDMIAKALAGRKLSEKAAIFTTPSGVRKGVISLLGLNQNIANIDVYSDNSVDISRYDPETDEPKPFLSVEQLDAGMSEPYDPAMMTGALVSSIQAYCKAHNIRL